MPSDEPRQYFYESGHGRIDRAGIEWWKCDGLCLDEWYRRENGKLVLMSESEKAFPGWVDNEVSI